MQELININGIISPKSDIVPLTRGQIEQLEGRFFPGVSQDEIVAAKARIQEWNKGILGNPDYPLVIKLPSQTGSMGDTIRGIHRIDLLRRWSNREPIVSTNIPDLLADHQTVPLPYKLDGAYELMAVLCDTNSAYFVPSKRKGWRRDRALAKAISTIDLMPYSIGVNQLQWLQVVSSAFFGQEVLEFPQAKISFSPEATGRAKRVVDELRIDSSQIPLLVYPDASKGLFYSKHWERESYEQTLDQLNHTWGDRIRIILMTGVDHPEETAAISNILGRNRIPHQVLAQNRNFAEFAAMVAEFGKLDSIMLGTESLVAGHLAPIFGIWSVILGWKDQVFHRVHNPIEHGSIIVEGMPTGRPSVDSVREALDFRVDLRLKNKSVD